MSDRGVCWRRVPEPQDDQYDTVITVSLARDAGYEPRRVDRQPEVFEGRVAVDNRPVPCALNCVPASTDHPNIARACELLKLWPAVWEQFPQVIHSVTVLSNVEWKEDSATRAWLGSTGEFGCIWATVDHPTTFAESLVHEMAHEKLFALGVQLESATRILTNPETDLFYSPGRFDKLEPMAAVLHAQYALTYVAALDTRIVQAAEAPEGERRAAAGSLANNLPRLRSGGEVIRRHAVLDAAGRDFLDGYFDWLKRLLEEGRRILRHLNMAEREFVHPLDSDANVSSFHQLTNERPRYAPGVIAYALPEEMMLYRPDLRIAFALNASAKAVWELCDGERTLRDIACQLAAKHGVTAELLSPDVLRIVIQLDQVRLLTLH